MTLHSFRWLNTTSLCTSLLCLFNYLFTNLLNAFCGNGTDARSALENRSNRTEFNNREKLYELPGWTLCSLSVYACACVFVLCAVCECVCCCIGVFVFVFFCIFSFFLWFFSAFFLYFYCVGHKKERQTAISARTLSSPHSAMAIGIFCWPQAELSNERVIDTIINKYRETQQTSSTFS